MLSRRAIAISAAALGAALVVGFRAVGCSSSVKDSDPFEAAMTSAASRVDAGLRAPNVLPLKAPSFEQALAPAIQKIASARDVPAKAREALIGDVARALLSRTSSPDAETYRRGRLQEGYRPRDREAMLRESPTLDAELGLAPGTCASQPIETTFAQAFARANSRANALPTGVLLQPALSAVAIKRITRVDPIGPILDEGEFAREIVWTGADLFTVRRWFDPPRTLTEMFDREGSALVAVVGFPVMFEAGPRLVQVHALWEPARGKWFVTGITYTRVERAAIVPMEH